MKEKENMENLAFELEDKEYTYDDLLKIEDENRYEIIDGVLYQMYSPRTIHQTILLELATQLKLFFNNKKCTPFVAPLDVRISGERDDKKVKDVVQPDLMVVCDKNKIDEKGICGAPDFIIEVMSPSNPAYDSIKKLNLYLKYKVKKYWLISPMDKKIYTYYLNGKKYDIEEYEIYEEVESHIFKDLKLNLKEIYE